MLALEDENAENAPEESQNTETGERVMVLSLP